MRTRMMLIGGLVILFGVWAALGMLSEDLAKTLIVLATWQWQAEALTPMGRAITAIAGGVMVGWGVTLFELGRAEEIPHARFARIVRAGLLTWFVADGLASVAAGAPLNLVLNSVLFALGWWATLEGRRPADTATARARLL